MLHNRRRAACGCVKAVREAATADPPAIMWASGELLEQWRVNSNIRNSNLGVLSSVRGQEGPIRVETSEKLHFIIAVRAQGKPVELDFDIPHYFSPPRLIG